MNEFTLAVSHIVLPIAFVDITVRVEKSTPPMGLAVEPESLVHGAIWPHNRAFSFSNLGAFPPLALILSSVFSDLLRTVF